MDALRSLLGLSPRRVRHATVDGDVIYPLFVMDDTKIYHNLILTWTFCFNDVLDADKLHSSLSQLLEIGDWRKLGGRLRQNKEGKFEVHVPQIFTPERPAVSFSRTKLDVNIDEHPLAKNIPRTPSSPSIQPASQTFRDFVVSPGTPVTAYDLLYEDTPQISLRVTSFNDATLVSLLWPHTLMDALGLQALLQAWSLVMAGRESEVLPVLGAREDAAAKSSYTSDEEPEEELKISNKRVQGLALVFFGLRFLWNLFWDGACESRCVFLPREAVERLRIRALEDAAASTDKAVFVSEGDVLAAWTTKIVASSEPRQRPVTILSALNLRYWMKSLTQSTGVYIQNYAMGTFAFLSPALVQSSIGRIAAEHRRYLLEQTTQPQLNAMVRTVHSENQNGDATFLFGDPKMLLVIITNWTKAKIMTSADFSPAVVRVGDTSKTRKNPPGSMFYFYYFLMKENMMTKNVMIVNGKDHEGNYWLTGTFLPRAWAKLEEELKML